MTSFVVWPQPQVSSLAAAVVYDDPADRVRPLLKVTECAGSVEHLDTSRHQPQCPGGRRWPGRFIDYPDAYAAGQQVTSKREPSRPGTDDEDFTLHQTLHKTLATIFC